MTGMSFFSPGLLEFYSVIKKMVVVYYVFMYVGRVENNLCDERFFLVLIRGTTSKSFNIVCAPNAYV